MRLEIDDFLELGRRRPIFDVRTPAEFARGHIPGASNLPLFTDDERALVGTTYKQEGSREAILRGLDLVGPKMRGLVERVIRVAGEPVAGEPVLVHCWRGGMRSESVAWLLGFYGYEVVTLEGGYKAFRRWVLRSFALERPILIVGGYTGSGKTLALYELERMGEQIIDLEGFANHRGSSFGGLGLPPQPTVEHFENMLATAWRELDPERRVWIEDESRMIGAIPIPKDLWEQMRAACVLVPNVDAEVRVAHLVDAYGEASLDALRASFARIRKRLGGLATQQALAALDEGDVTGASRYALQYYDRAYDYGLGKRDPEHLRRFDVGAVTPAELAARLIEEAP